MLKISFLTFFWKGPLLRQIIEGPVRVLQKATLPEMIEKLQMNFPAIRNNNK